MDKVKEIENLKKQREVEMQRIGTAHADAVAAKEKKLEEELRKKEREIRD